MLAMSYLTAPFVKRVVIQVPERARYSREALMAFSQKLPKDTRLEFTTLRTFPFRRTTGATLSDLRALPPQRGRFANIQLLKTNEWHQQQKKINIFMKFWNILAEPRWKFYVKEGRSYTIRTKAPGVWENVALVIQQRTREDAAKAKPAELQKQPLPRRPIQPVTPITSTKLARPEPPKLKRQTSRPPS